MASPANKTPAKNNDEDDGDYPFSYFQKTVTLCDWWLVKAEKDHEGKRLAVAGFGPREQQALRVFRSAPISKRYDPFTLQTADGITVILQGFINKTRSIENGFSTEVFSYFLFGFPHSWEEYAKKLLDSHIDAANNFNCRQLTANPAIKGSKESNPFSAWNKPVSTCGDEHHSAGVEDCCHALSIVVSKEPDMQISSANLNSSVQEKSNAIIHSNVQYDYLEVVENYSISQDECHSSFSKGPLDKNFKHEATDASEDNPTSLTFDNSSLTLMEVAIASSQVEPAEYHLLGSTATVDGSERSKETKNGLVGVLKTKISASPGSTTMIDDVSVECPVPDVSNVGNINVPTVNSTVSPRASVVVLALSSKWWKSLKYKQKEKNMERLHMGTTNFSIASLPQSLEVVSRSADDNIIDKGSEPRFPTVGDSNVLKPSKYHVKGSMLCYTFQSGEEANATPSISRSKNNDSTRVLNNKQKQRSISGCSVKRKAGGSISDTVDHVDGKKLSRESFKNVVSTKKENLQGKMLRASRSLKSTSGISKSKEKDRQTDGEVSGSSRKKAKRRISFHVHESPQTLERKEKTCIRSPESLSLKRSRSGRLLLPTLDFWRNQIPVYDMNRNITGIQEELGTEKPYRGSKSEPWRKRGS